MSAPDRNIPNDQQNPQATEPAYPCEGPNATAYGLTKRELFAAMMAQAILTGAVTRGCPSNEWIDQSMAVKCADALLAALDQTHG